MNLFQRGNFTLHSGEKSKWKIECDALSWEDWDTLAMMIVERTRPLLFAKVIGVPRGGLKLARALMPYQVIKSGPTLVVDDVLTTGNSILEVVQGQLGPCIAWVVFARGVCPPGINALFRMSDA